MNTRRPPTGRTEHPPTTEVPHEHPDPDPEDPPSTEPIISLDDPRVTAAQRAIAQGLIDDVRTALAAFPTVEAVEAAGYTSIGDGGADGYEHYVNWSYLTDGREFDPHRVDRGQEQPARRSCPPCTSSTSARRWPTYRRSRARSRRSTTIRTSASRGRARGAGGRGVSRAARSCPRPRCSTCGSSTIRAVPSPASRPRQRVRHPRGALARPARRVSAGPVAQWSEQGTHNPSVGGSIPPGPAIRRLVRMATTTWCWPRIDTRTKSGASRIENFHAARAAGCLVHSTAGRPTSGRQLAVPAGCGNAARRAAFRNEAWRR